MFIQGPFRVGSLLLLFPFLCPAGSLPRLSLEEMVAQSDSIVAGRIVRAWTAMDSENKFIWTHYELTVRSTLKGSVAAIVTISEPGGTLYGRTLHVPGSTSYAVGEEVGVFLYRTPIGYLRTANYGQGKLVFSTDGRVHVNHSIDLTGAVVSTSAAPSTGSVNFETLDGLSWSAVESRVARILSRQAVRR